MENASQTHIFIWVQAFRKGESPSTAHSISDHLKFSKPLYIQDVNGKLLSLTMTAPDHIKKDLQDAIMLIQALMPGELKDENSSRESFKFLSCHYTWYARFAENVSLLLSVS